MNNQTKDSNVISDISSLFAEIISEMVKVLIFVLGEIVRAMLSKIAGQSRGCSKIKIECIGKKTQSKRQDSIGISLKNKSELLYKNINSTLHTFIAGASGFGKTVLILLLQDRAMARGNSVVFIDPKGDLESKNEFRAICKKHNRKCYVFSETELSEILVNPLRDGTRTQVAERIMDAFIWSEQYYRDMSFLALTEILQKLEKERKPFSLHSILDLYEHEFLTDKNQSLYVKLKTIKDSDFGDLFRDDGSDRVVTLEKIRDEGAAIYIGLSAQAYNEIAYAIGKLFLGELLHLSYTTLRDGKRETVRPMSVFFDEFGSIVTNRFIELLNKCRAAKIELCMAVQSIADIDKIDPCLKDQIVENSSNLFIFKQRLDTSASFFSNAIGTIETKKQTEQIDEEGNRGGRSERIVHEHIIHPDLIKNLKVGQCVLLRQNPMKVDLINVRRIDLSPFQSSELKEVSSIKTDHLKPKHIFGA